MALGETLSFADERAKSEAPRTFARSQRLGMRHLKVAELIAQGMRHKEIAFALGISVSASKVYTHELYRRAGLSSLVDVANWVHGRSARDAMELLKLMGVAA